MASSASEALDLVRAQPEINLVLSDVMMEGASGYDLLCRIRAIRSHVSVIMLSAYESSTAARAREPRFFFSKRL